MTGDEVIVDVSRDWATACDVLERFMQHVGPTIRTLNYSVRCRQVRALGGFLRFMPLPHNRLVLTVGDASGKGLAALTIFECPISLRTAVPFTGYEGPVALTTVNRQVCASSLEDLSATLFYGVIDGTTPRLQYVSVGHNPPMGIGRECSIIWL